MSDKPVRPLGGRMQANPAFCQLYPEHAQEHNETPMCSFGFSCRPVDPPAPTGLAPTAPAYPEAWIAWLRKTGNLPSIAAAGLLASLGLKLAADVYGPRAPDQARDDKRSTT